MTTHPPLLGLVLAGGHSRRMGRDKAALRIDGVSWLQRTVDLLSQCRITTQVAIRPDQADEPLRGRFDCLLDPPGGLGPIGAIHGALKAHPDHGVLVVACDLVDLRVKDLQRLIDARDPTADATVMQSSNGSIHPLCAIWEACCLHALTDAIESGQRSPRRFLEGCARVKQVAVPEPERLDGVNTPPDA